MIAKIKDAWDAGPGPRKPAEFVTLLLKGLLMGAADLVPGVSGGTVAFVTGIYEPMLEAIASINKKFIQLVLKFKIFEALAHIHLRFLVPLAFGILFSIFSLARLMHYLLHHQAILTWSMFFGLISASIIVVWRELDKPFAPISLFWIVFGGIFAYGMVSLIPVQTPTASWFIYLCGIIGITAMILPGLSGSFLLLILGKYEYITGAVKAPFVEGNLPILLIFFAGTLTGLFSFSKGLNWLLKHKRTATMAFLTGILIGSMKKIWPWKKTLESVVIRGKTRILREENIIPDFSSNETIMAFVLIGVGFALVMGLEFLGRARKSEDKQELPSGAVS